MKEETIMNRQEFLEEIMALAARAEKAAEPYIAEGLRHLARLIEENREGAYVSLLTYADKCYKQLT